MKFHKNRLKAKKAQKRNLFIKTLLKRQISCAKNPELY